MVTKIRKSSQFRSIYASGVRVASSPTEIRILFTNLEPLETDSEKEGYQAIGDAIHCQAEVIMSRPLAEWLKNTLEAYLKAKAEGSM